MRNIKVAITGLGCVSAAGINLSDTVHSFRTGQRKSGYVTLFKTDLKHPVFEVKNMMRNNKTRSMRTLSLALQAVNEAICSAGYQDGFRDLKVGVCLGTTVASQLNDINFYRAFREYGTAPMDSIDKYLKGNIAEAIGKEVRATGPCCTIVNACSSGTDAIGVGMSWLRSGICDVVIAGGADEINQVPFCGFNSLGIMSNELCMPFDRNRQGLNLGEGAGILILENSSINQSPCLGKKLFLAGYGACSDAYHLTAPHPKGVGLERAVTQALSEACIEPRDVSFINAHGTATHDNDLVESNVLAKIFGSNINMISTKGFTGHTLGAAGGLEAVFTAAAMCEGWIPECAGFANKDDEIPIIPLQTLSVVKGQYALSTSLGFGGNNAAIVIKIDET